MAAGNPNPAEAKGGAIAVTDTLHAPVIYFEIAPNFGCNNGIVNVTLAVGRHLANDKGGVDVDAVAAAFLRCNIPAAIDLRNALNSALLLGTPAAGGSEAN